MDLEIYFEDSHYDFLMAWVWGDQLQIPWLKSLVPLTVMGETWGVQVYGWRGVEVETPIRHPRGGGK